MHHIQRHILGTLIRSPAVRYSRLKPERVDPNLFTYHLKHLLADGLACKRADGLYELSVKGKNMADKLQLESFELPWETQPRLTILIAVRDEASGWLLHRRSVQPVINMVGFLHANVAVGESILVTAEKRLLNLCGLSAKAEYKGSGLITLYQGEELESYISFHLVLCREPKGELITKCDIGENFWQKEPDFQDPALLPSMRELCRNIDTAEGPFFAELTYRL